MNVNYHLMNGSVVINYEGKTVTVAKNDSRFEPVVQAIREDRLDEIPDLVDVEKQFADQGLELRDGLVLVDGEQMPNELNDRILEFKDAGLPFDRLVKFWNNLKLNPSFNSKRMLYKFLEHNGHPLTEDGCFIAYRGVTEDFKDPHTRTFDNSPGSVCEMPREEVDDNPNNTCSSGLHVACYNYAAGFGSRKIEVKVNPRDVVAVPSDYDGTKMRTCKFEVLAECEGMRTGPAYDPDSEEEHSFMCAECGEVFDDEDALNENDHCPECEDEYCAGCGEEKSDTPYCPECGCHN